LTSLDSGVYFQRCEVRTGLKDSGNNTKEFKILILFQKLEPINCRAFWNHLSCRSGELLVQVTTDADQSADRDRRELGVGLSRDDVLLVSLSLFRSSVLRRPVSRQFRSRVDILLLTTVVLACLGILSSSFAMVFKRGVSFGM